ncbi:MAG: glycerol-3-phosphate 1-O-acyltransferase PlsY [Pseudomonadota bacterium]|nr:glycerol-3-phosphate 1-O-acyltransferase PlsY [Pseudomonadota bacterium]
MSIEAFAASILLGYLCGSIPFGLLLTRLAGLGDIRSIGSGNIGATNVLRTGSKKTAALTLVLDALKGAAPVLIAGQLGANAAIAAGMAAFAGHVLPVWLKFRGGKGVATYVGVLFAMWWPLGLSFLAVWIVVALASRISSLSALAASSVIPLLAFFRPGGTAAVACLALSLAIFLTHRTNLSRLLRNQEPAMTFSRKD